MTFQTKLLFSIIDSRVSSSIDLAITSLERLRPRDDLVSLSLVDLLLQGGQTNQS